MDGDGFSTAVYCRASLKECQSCAAHRSTGASANRCADCRRGIHGVVDMLLLHSAVPSRQTCPWHLRGWLCWLCWLREDQWWSVMISAPKLKPVGGADLGLGAGKWRPGSMEHRWGQAVAGTLRSGVFGADGHVYCPPWCSRRVPPWDTMGSPDPLCTWQDEHGSPFVTFPNMTQ